VTVGIGTFRTLLLPALSDANVDGLHFRKLGHNHGLVCPLYETWCRSYPPNDDT
jgi:hypothetical protein